MIYNPITTTVDFARRVCVGEGLRDACAPDFEFAPSHGNPLGFRQECGDDAQLCIRVSGGTFKIT